MNNLANNSNIVNKRSFLERAGDWYQRHWWDIVIFTIIFLAILSIAGFLRLNILTSTKNTIFIE